MSAIAVLPVITRGIVAGELLLSSALAKHPLDTLISRSFASHVGQ